HFTFLLDKARSACYKHLTSMAVNGVVKKDGRGGVSRADTQSSSRFLGLLLKIRLTRFLRLTLKTATAALLCGSVFAQSSYVNFEGKQTSPIRLSADGTRLFAVNTPDARVS